MSTHIERRLKNSHIHYCPSNDCGEWEIVPNHKLPGSCPKCGIKMQSSRDYDLLLDTYYCKLFDEKNEESAYDRY